MSYGTDLSTFAGGPGAEPDLDPMFEVIEGPRVVLENCARRLMTDNGSLEDAPEYGYNLTNQVGRRMSPVAKLRMGADIEAELIKEDGVQAVKVLDFAQGQRGRWELRIRFTLASGTFTSVFGVTNSIVEILRTTKS